MRRFLFASALGALLPGAAFAASLYSTSPVQAAGDVALPEAGAGASALGAGQGGGVFGSGAGSAQSGAFPYSGYSGYSGVRLPSPLRSHPFPLKSAALQGLVGGVKPRALRHRWAVGVDAIPAAALARPSGSPLAVPNALSVRWWGTDRLAVDLQLGGDFNSSQSGKGELSPLLSTAPGSAFYAGGLGLRYNISQLSHDLLSQLVIKASGAQAAGDIVSGSAKATQTTLAVFVGAGFEAFVPGWDWLSVEGSVGLTGFAQSLTPQGGSAETASGLGLAGSGFSPINLAAHAYF